MNFLQLELLKVIQHQIKRQENEPRFNSKAKDNTIRTSPLKLANIARSIVNKKANIAINQLKFSNKRI